MAKLLTCPHPYNQSFVGRQKELMDIRQKFVEQGINVLMLTGEAGIGKTEIAAQYFHTYMDKYNCVAWVSVKDTFRRDMLKAFNKILKAINPGIKNNNTGFNELIMYLSNIQGQSLLVLDNVNNLEELEQYGIDLARMSNFDILLTTRISTLNNADFYHIDGLPYEQALQLFKKSYFNHQEQEDEIFRAIHAAVGQNTLVVELLAKNLLEHNRFRQRYPLSNLLQDLQSNGVLGLSHIEKVFCHYMCNGVLHWQKEKMDYFIEIMYDTNVLTEQELVLLQRIAKMPPEFIPCEGIEEKSEAEQWGVIDFEDTFFRTIKKGWIIYNENESTFKLSPVVRSVLTKQ